MGHTLEYRGYRATVKKNPNDGILCGKLKGIRSGILFDETEADSIKDAFKLAVDEYLADCEDEGIEPESPNHHDNP